jgi:hypothetical protein
MNQLLDGMRCLLAALLLAWLAQPAQAQAPKELKTRPGVAVAMVNLVNPRPDCSINPGPVALPSLRQKPANGNILMQIVISDVAANGNCPARKMPTIAIAYAPRKDFTGVETVELEIDTDNRATLLSYRITVSADAQAQPL